MAISIVMPALEMAQETGKLVAWRKKEGESVAKGETLLEVETDKAVMEIEAPGDGILAGVKVREGDVVPVGQTIAWLVRPGEVPPHEAVPSNSARYSSAAPAPVATVGVASGPTASSGGKLSPKARRLAREHGVDIRSLRGSGPDGSILAEDILARRTSANGTPAADVTALSSVARLMAERTTQSWTSVPHFFLAREVDASGLNEIRRKFLEKGERPTHTDLLVALLARILVSHPRMNGSWTGNGIRLNHEVNMAVAMAVKDGVVGAVIHNADKTDLSEISRQRKDLTERARAGRLRPADIAGASFTISNLGMYEIDTFNAIISPPQVGILAVGRIADRVVPVDGKPGIRPMMTLTLSCDHRIVDGAYAAVFLKEVAAAIREPEGWLR